MKKSVDKRRRNSYNEINNKEKEKKQKKNNERKRGTDHQRLKFLNLKQNTSSIKVQMNKEQMRNIIANYEYTEEKVTSCR